MPEFISDVLTHWTGRDKPEEEAFNIVKSIVESRKLLLTYCPNYPKLEEKYQKRTMMVCFTDIPLELSKEQCERFGKFGIGFSKPKMMEYGANPVFYTTPKMNKQVEGFMSLLYRLQGEEVDREWKDAKINGGEGDRYQFDTKQFYSMLEVAGFMQNYQYKETSVDYYQREWRISYDSLPHATGMTPQDTPGQGAIHGTVGEGDKRRVACSMLFDIDDIDYIVVPRSFKEQAEALVDGLSAEVKIYEDEVRGA